MARMDRLTFSGRGATGVCGTIFDSLCADDDVVMVPDLDDEATPPYADATPPNAAAAVEYTAFALFWFQHGWLKASVYFNN